MLDPLQWGVCPSLSLRQLCPRQLRGDISLPPPTVRPLSSLSLTLRPHLTGLLLSSSKYSLHFTAWGPPPGFPFPSRAGLSQSPLVVPHLPLLSWSTLPYVRPHFNCPLCEDVCVDICRLDLSRKLQTPASDCLLDISICMCLIGISNITVCGTPRGC